MFIFVFVLSMLLVANGRVEEQPKTDDGAQERLIALYSTFSLTTLSSTTTTVAFSCNIVPTAATACRRRRRRRSNAQAVDLSLLAAPEVATPELMTSMDRQKRDVAGSPEAKLFFTVWTTTRTTLTTTVKSTDFSTTHSFTLLCTAPGQTLLPLCAAELMVGF